MKITALQSKSAILAPIVAAGLFVSLAFIWYTHRSLLDVHANHGWLVKGHILTSERPVEIPKRLHQTYVSRDRVPDKVWQNIQRFAPEYTHKIYDDAEVSSFLQEHFHESVVQSFDTLQAGAHKADLFRYCVLYVVGGIYLDVKTQLVQPLAPLFPNGTITSVISRQYNEVYQGVIGAPPRQPIFLALIAAILKSGSDAPYSQYLRDFMNYIRIDLGHRMPKEGANFGQRQAYFMYSEHCWDDIMQCEDGPDRYGFCCEVQLGGSRVIKTRYSDYPW